MNTLKHARNAAAALLVSLLVFAAARADAEETAAPAWQAVDFVMEEVVVTAKVPVDPAMPAWQSPGFVMEEVVTTAGTDVAETTPAWQEPGYVMEEVVATAKRPATGASPERRSLLLTLYERHARRRAELDAEDAGDAAGERLL